MNKEGKIISFEADKNEIIKISSGSKIIGIWLDLAERELGKYKKENREKTDKSHQKLHI